MVGNDCGLDSLQSKQTSREFSSSVAAQIHLPGHFSAAARTCAPYNEQTDARRQATYGPLWAGVTGDEGVNRLQALEVATNKTHGDVRGLFAQFIR
jgi:hypothetical protein